MQKSLQLKWAVYVVCNIAGRSRNVYSFSAYPKKLDIISCQGELSGDLMTSVSIKKYFSISREMF